MSISLQRLHVSSIVAAGLLTFGSGSALAADKCSVPKAEWQAQAVLKERLEKDGWSIRNIKIDKGCYEVYGFDKAGNRMETYFDPKTLEPLKG